MSISASFRGGPTRVRSARLRNVVAAALLAVLAAGLTLLYVSRAGNRQATTAPSSVSVLVAARDIPIGTTAAQLLNSDWLHAEPIASADVVSGAVTDRSQLSGLVATQTIYGGEQITTHRLGTAGQQGLRTSLHGTLRIVEVPGDNQQVLAGTLRNGDRVDVVASVRNPESGQNHYSGVVLRNLLVVDAPSTSGGGALQGQATASVKLQLTDEQEQRMFWVEKNADWTLVLRPAEDATSSNAAPASAANVLRGTNGH